MPQSRTSGTAMRTADKHRIQGEQKTRYGADAAPAGGIEGMELRCRVCKFYITCNKLGNKARNVFKTGALHTPSLRLDFFAPLFVSRQKGEKGNEIKPCP